jgi:hypothetical protein
VETLRVAVHGKFMALEKEVGVTGQNDRIVVTPFDTTCLRAVVKTLSEVSLNAYALKTVGLLERDMGRKLSLSFPLRPAPLKKP